MKRNHFLLWLFGALLVASACSGEKEKMLCQRWQVSNVIFLNEKEAIVLSDTMQGDMQKVTQAILKDILMKNIYEFHDDGTYRTGNAAASSTGKWEFEGNAIRFISDSQENTSEGAEGKKNKLIPYEKLEQDSLILLMKNDQTSFQMKLVMIPLR